MDEEVSDASAPMVLDLDRLVSREASDTPVSGIVDVFNYGRGRQGLIPLWVGEGDLPTPSFIRAAAIRSIEAGETFYTHQRGIPELRDAIARYMTQHYGGGSNLSSERFFVTVGGMHALQIAMRLIGSAGAEVLLPTPAWTNFKGALSAQGVRTVESPMILTGGTRRRWTLDMDHLTASITERTRAIVINSPSNPLGWTATIDELRAILDLARRHGLWIIADEIYGQFVFQGTQAPSFHDIMDDRDLILFPQTFSKNWAMTGWRIGWLEAPPALGQMIENLVQYSTSGVAIPTQRAATAAIISGADFAREQVARAKVNRNLLSDALSAQSRIRFAPPEGAFYLFFGIEGFDDPRRLAYRLVDEAGLGLAPGDAFGAGGEGFLRMCFARSTDQMRTVVERLTTWLAQNA